MKTTTVGKISQNPTAVLAEVEAGESYRITRHSREIARLVPPLTEAQLVSAKHRNRILFPKLPATYTPPDLDAIELMLDRHRS